LCNTPLSSHEPRAQLPVEFRFDRRPQPILKFSKSSRDRLHTLPAGHGRVRRRRWFWSLSHSIDIRSMTSPVAADLMTNTITGGSLAGMRRASRRSNRRERFLLIIFVISGL